MPGIPTKALKKTPIKTASGNLRLVPPKARRLPVLVAVVFCQSILLSIAAQGIRLVMGGNLFGIALLLCFSIPGSAIIWYHFFEDARLSAEVLVDAANERIEIKALPFSQAASFRRYRQESYRFPFQDLEALQLVPGSGDTQIVQIRIKGATGAITLCGLPNRYARHLVRHISGMTGCTIQGPAGEEPFSPLPAEAIWDPASESETSAARPRTRPYSAVIFGLLAAAAAVFKTVDPRPPVWFYLGIHFQATLSIAGMVFFIKGRDMLGNAWKRLEYFFLLLLSLFLFLSLFFPSRSLFSLCIAILAVLTPVAVILKIPSADASKPASGIKRVSIVLVGIIVAAPFAGYGYFASKEVSGFFSQPQDDIVGIAFFEIEPPRHVENAPTVIVRQPDQIREIMAMLQESVSQSDPRRVERHYRMQIKHLAGTSYFATVGRMRNQQGCILFSSKFGLWGWEFGGYDNPDMIRVLQRGPGLWPDEGN